MTATTMSPEHMETCILLEQMHFTYISQRLFFRCLGEYTNTHTHTYTHISVQTFEVYDFFFKFVSEKSFFAQGCIYLIKITVKTI